jgi:hypothetical protein
MFLCEWSIFIVIAMQNKTNVLFEQNAAFSTLKQVVHTEPLS